MATDYYVDSGKPDDTGDGLSWGNAKKHVSAAVGLLSDPISDDVTIHMKGTQASPQSYIDITDQEIELEDLNFAAGGGASLTFQAENWNQSNYEDDEDPYDAAGNWDPKGTKPCTLPPFKLTRTKNVTFKGVGFEKSDDEHECAVLLAEGSGADFHYCAASDCTIGILSHDHSHAWVYNCHLFENRIGAGANNQSLLNIVGENYFVDNLRIGIMCRQSSTVLVQAWGDDPMKFVTDLRTTTELLKYTAVKIEMNSSFDIQDAHLDDDDVDVAHVRVINETAYRSKLYHGVMVGSKSLFTGAENISFADPAVNQGKETVPSDLQIVVKDDGTALD